MGHCIDLPEEPQNLEQVLSDCKETLKYCVKTGESYYVIYMGNSTSFAPVLENTL